MQFVASGRKLLGFGAGELRLCVLNLVCFSGDVVASLFTQGSVLKLHSHQSAALRFKLRSSSPETCPILRTETSDGIE